MKVLIISPIHDAATIISANAVRHLVEWIDKENVIRVSRSMPKIEYKLLSGFKANRLSVWFNKDVDAIFYYGHGLKDRLGDIWIYMLPIIDRYNIHWFKDKIIYTMSCLSGRILAKKAIEKGVKAYFGQIEKYYGFLPTISEEYLKYWYELVNIIPITLMKGDSCFVALQKYEIAARDIKAKLLSMEKKENLSLLFSNAFYMHLFGNNTAKLSI